MATDNRTLSTEAYVPMTKDMVHISGYLLKLTRDGKWQRRWFETNGCFLTYYKTRRMEKLLAALNLPQVGEITLVKENDETAGLFSIELNERVYKLKAANPAEAQKVSPRLSPLFALERPSRRAPVAYVRPRPARDPRANVAHRSLPSGSTL